MNGLRLLAPGAGLILAAYLPFCLATGQSGGSEPQPRPAKLRTLHLPDVLPRYADVELPAHFRTRPVRRFDNTPADNPITDAGATLGRVLFYDTRLSANNTIACASCHQQKHAFADPRRFSKGIDGKDGDRNAMSLVNARFYPTGRFFWDERASSLEKQVLMPIQSKAEMGQDLTTLVALLGKDERYAELFRKAFGDSQITPDRIARCWPSSSAPWCPATRNMMRACSRPARSGTTSRTSPLRRTGARRSFCVTVQSVICRRDSRRSSTRRGRATMAWTPTAGSRTSASAT